MSLLSAWALDYPPAFAGNDLIRHPGRFEIGGNVIRSAVPELLLMVFSGIVVVRAEHRFVDRVIEYEGLSMHFDEIDMNEMTPPYEPIIAHDRDGDADHYSVTWKRLP